MDRNTIKYKGIIHFHSEYSFDSNLKIKSIVEFAMKYNLNFLALTDHNTIKGALALKKYVEKNNLKIEVVIGAEYYTNLGDIIALGIQHEIRTRDFQKLIEEVKNQGGIILFPHPYKSHKDIEYIASKVDMVEIFNSRVEDKLNKKALLLAKKLRKKTYCASDAHVYYSLRNCIVEFYKYGNIIESLLYSDISCNCIKSLRLEVIHSQIIKAYKKKSARIFFYQVLKTGKLLMRGHLFKRI